MFIKSHSPALMCGKASGTFLGLSPVGHGCPAVGEMGLLLERVSSRVTICAPKFRQLRGLPEPAPGAMYVVSALAAQACGDRDDVLVPGRAIRDQGRKRS